MLIGGKLALHPDGPAISLAAKGLHLLQGVDLGHNLSSIPFWVIVLSGYCGYLLLELLDLVIATRAEVLRVLPD